MVSIDCIEHGIARYIEEAFLPTFPRDGVKGFALGVAASLLIKRGGAVLREYIKNPTLQQMGLVTPDGAVDLDAIREAALKNLPATGLSVDLPLGVAVRINAVDVENIYNMIKRESNI